MGGSKRTKPRLSPLQGKTKTVRGTISELIAAADLMEKGYEVFRAMEPCATCDLIALKGSEVLRVQVRTGNVYHRLDGVTTMYYSNTARDAERTDRFAIVVGKEVIYKDSTIEVLPKS